MVGQGTNGITTPVNNMLKRMKNLVTKSTLANFFPNLLNGIHLQCRWREKKYPDVLWNNKLFRPVPTRTITDQNNMIICVLCRQFLQENVHAICIAIGQKQKARFARQGFDRPIGIVIFADMMAWHNGAHALVAPAVFRFVDPPETRFKSLIDELMKMDDIIIEIIGCFVWVTGDTKPYREQLKALKFQWNSKKIAWYLKPENYRKQSRRNYDFDKIRAMYGSNGQVNSRGTTKLDEAVNA